MTIDILALLKRLEWNHGGVEFCPECLCAKEMGHILQNSEVVCDLGIAISQLEEQREGIQLMAMRLADAEIQRRTNGLPLP